MCLYPGEPTNSATCTPWSAASISAAFSPIMIDAALVLPLTTLGMTLASATRRPATPAPVARGSTTLPIRHVDREVVHGQRVVAGQVLEQVVARAVARRVAVLGGERRRDEQRADALVRRPVRDDVERAPKTAIMTFMSWGSPIVVHADVGVRRVGSALARTISPSLCGCTGLASTMMLSASGASATSASSKYSSRVDPQQRCQMSRL